MAIKTTYALKITRDDYVESPRTSYDNAGTMVCWHRKYNLGDNHNYEDPMALLEDLASVVDSEEARNLSSAYWEDDSLTEQEYLRKLMEIAEDGYHILPLYLYDHSGITMNTGGFLCPWDSGQVGYIYMSYDTAREEAITNPIVYLEGEVETYDQYLRGDVYGFEIVELLEYEDGFIREGDTVDSCWGFYGDDLRENGMLSYIDAEKYGLEIKSMDAYDYREVC